MRKPYVLHIYCDYSGKYAQLPHDLHLSSVKHPNQGAKHPVFALSLLVLRIRGAERWVFAPRLGCDSVLVGP